MSKHTPGPWRWLNDSTLVADYGRRRPVLCAKDEGSGLEQYNRDPYSVIGPFDPQSPDARLIAESPVLLEALKEMTDMVIWMSGSPDFGPDGQAHEGWLRNRDKVNKALDAIAKAGEEI